jgi:hypothetical protein
MTLPTVAIFRLSQVAPAHGEREHLDLAEHLLRRLADGFLFLEEIHRADALVERQKQIDDRRRRQPGAELLAPPFPLPAIDQRAVFQPIEIPELLLAEA